MLGFWGKDLNQVLNQTQIVNVEGVRFRIKKLDPFSYMDGSNAVAQVYQTYEQKKELSEANMNKVREHYRDVFMAAVVDPKLIRKADDGDGTLVDNLFSDWTLANELYSKILAFTYGKKKRLFF